MPLVCEHTADPESAPAGWAVLVAAPLGLWQHRQDAPGQLPAQWHLPPPRQVARKQPNHSPWMLNYSSGQTGNPDEPTSPFLAEPRGSACDDPPTISELSIKSPTLLNAGNGSHLPRYKAHFLF